MFDTIARLEAVIEQGKIYVMDGTIPPGYGTVGFVDRLTNHLELATNALKYKLEKERGE